MKYLLVLALVLVGCTAPKDNDIYDQKVLSKQILNIYATDCLGTGWGIDHRTVVSCFHVVENGIIGMESPTECWRAMDTRCYPEPDIAFITVPERPEVEPMALASLPPKLGEEVYCYGYAMGSLLGVTKGEIFFIAPNMYLADMTVIPGMSGGPVVNNKGEVLGMAQAFLGQGRPLAKIIPIEVIKQYYHDATQKDVR